MRQLRRPPRSTLLAAASAALLLVAGSCGNHRMPAAAAADSLAIEGVTLVPTFSPLVTDYVADVGYATTAVRVTAAVAVPGSALAIDDVPVASGGRPAARPVAVGSTVIRVQVVGPDSVATRTYRIVVRRAPGLDALPLDNGRLVPAFDPEVTEYDVDITAPSLQLGPLVVAPGTGVAVDGTPLAAGAAPRFELAMGRREVELALTSADGTTGRRYLLHIERRAPALGASTYLKASNTGQLDRFGQALAADAGTYVLGAPREDSAGDPLDDSKADSGAVYVFAADAGVWREEAYLKAPHVDPFDMFGFAVAIRGDLLVIGAPNEASRATGVDGDGRDNGAPQSGAVFVFERTGGVWQRTAYLKASNTGIDDHFGWAVAIAGDRIVVGAPDEASAARSIGGDQGDDSAPGAGAVYVFARAGGGWAQEAYVKAFNTGTHDRFGASVATDGEWLLVGAPGEDGAGRGVAPHAGDDNGRQDAGAVYAYRRQGGGWLPAAYVKASNTGAGDRFGSALTLDGPHLVVGAPGEASAATGVGGDESDDSAPGAGAAYAFLAGASGWEQIAYLKAANTDAGDGFACSLASGGGMLVAGAVGEDGAAAGIDGDAASNALAGAGAAYLFLRDGRVWFGRHYLKASNPDAGDGFGSAVAVGGVGPIASAPCEGSAATGVGGNQGDNSRVEAGAAYLFTAR